MKLNLLALVLCLGALNACSPPQDASAPSREPAAKAAVQGELITAPMATNTAVAAAPATTAPVLENKPAATEYSTVSFDQISNYTLLTSDEIMTPATNQLAEAKAKLEAQIPGEVKAFNKKKVALKGFMLPLKVEAGYVTELLIMRDQSMCCYGAVPKLNEWVSVKMSGQGVRPVMDTPVVLYGTLRVEEMRENGFLVGIYSMEGHKMDAP